MNLLDSSAWIEILGSGPNEAAFRPIAEAPAELLVPTLCLTEVFKVVSRRVDQRAALAAVAIMRRGQIISLDDNLAVAAAQIGVSEGLALADSIILATARHFDATLWTQDADFDGLEGVRYLPHQA